MYQVTFSEQSINELNKLDKLEQMSILERLSNVNAQELQEGSDEVGHVNRKGHTFYRLRVSELRIYFEIDADTLKCQYVLPKHSLTDLVFRLKLPATDEQMIEQHDSFWKYLETLTK